MFSHTGSSSQDTANPPVTEMELISNKVALATPVESQLNHACILTVKS